ncbi:MAG: hypothetical protein LPK80_00130, partial [Bacteroidota bacterium]|nr:hypothetical protein [Bacteroidota bacterium]
MKNSLLNEIIGIIGLVLLQGLVLNNVALFGYLNPYIYLVVILTLPPQFGNIRLMFVGFFLGFTIDIFENSGALHASATTFLAFIRPSLLRLVATQGGEEFGRLNLSTMGTSKFLIYSAFGVIFHHIWLFTLETFKFLELPQVFFRSLLSGAFSLTLILLLQLLL